MLFICLTFLYFKRKKNNRLTHAKAWCCSETWELIPILYLGQYSEYSHSSCIKLPWGKEAGINIPRGINSTYVYLLSTSFKASQILPGRDWTWKGQRGPLEKSKAIMDEIQPAERDDAFYYTRWYYWKSEQAPLLGSEEGAKLESMSSSSGDRVSPASITSLYLQTHHHGCNNYS